MTKPDARQKMIEAGIDAIVAKSYNGCGLKEILDAAGVPKGSFYYYFKSKEELGVTVIEHIGVRHTERLREHFQGTGSPLDRLRAFFDWARTYFEGLEDFRRNCAISKLALEIGDLSEPMRGAIKTSYDAWQQVTRELLDEAKAAGELAATVDTAALADFVNLAWEGHMVRMEIDRAIRPVDTFVHYLCDVLLPALAPGAAATAASRATTRRPRS